MSARIVCIGECMLELRAVSDDLLRVGYAGDTYNTAFYLARETDDAEVDFASVVGRDPYSERMLEVIASTGVGTRLIGRSDTRTVGLYLISTGDGGERSFTYYRDQSAARTLFDAGYADRFGDAIAGAQLIYFSGITLSILAPAARVRMFAAIVRARAAGARAVFDSNYRVQGWSSPAVARETYEHAYRNVDLALPSYEDEALLFGDPSPAACAERLAGYGLHEIVVKHGSGPGIWRRGEQSGTFLPERVEHVVDTTGAGDSFNAGYLAARLQGLDPAVACARGSALAAAVTQISGAIMVSAEPRRPALSSAGSRQPAET
jgi:2-dehydro-3-deoxygluconokinase